MKKINTRTFFRLWRYLEKYKGKFLGSISLTVLMTIFNVLEPFILGLGDYGNRQKYCRIC